MSDKCQLCGGVVSTSGTGMEKCFADPEHPNRRCAFERWTDAEQFDRIQSALAFDTPANRAKVKAFDEGVKGTAEHVGDMDNGGRGVVVHATLDELGKPGPSLYGKRVRVVIEKEHGDG